MEEAGDAERGDSGGFAEDRLTAWHEAGHAVSYLLHGRTPRYVTLRPRSPVGRTAMRPHRSELSTVAVIAHAGPLAQARYTLTMYNHDTLHLEGLTRDDLVLGAYLHGGHDDMAIIKTARQAYGLPARRSDPWSTTAELLVDEHWPAIDRVARALLAHRTLTGAQITEIADSA
ncbi:hypothetical protein [Amycolatopsis sp. NPDC059657]|uniref:hypothetical protein n=1 Tax=Amycolatopsis sp. NPDC059657 TaxID=3346899 RepID=UPI00366B1153